MSPSLPAAIEDVLNKHNVEFQVQMIQSDSLATVQTLLLQDGQGKLQAFYPSGSLLNIDGLRQLTGRELKALNKSETAALCNAKNLQDTPGVPLALGVEVVIDSQLLDAQQLLLDSGNQQTVVQLGNAQFKALIADAKVGELSISESDLQSTTLDEARDVEDITQAVANFTQLRIKHRLEETLEFPPLPDTAQRIIKLRVDPNADIGDLTDIVESDPSLAAQVVSWAASPYYAAPGKIKSVHDAIVRVLGFDLVLNLSLGLALGKTLNLPKDSAKGFTPYWQQAVYAAAAVEALVGAIPPKERPAMGMAYLSGLLHNFGYLILAEVFPPHFSNICRYQEANLYSNHSFIERHLLGVTREQLGAWLMRLWNMPDEVCTAIRFQNEKGFEGEDSAYANLMYIAMRLLRTHGIGDAPLDPIPAELYERLHLDPQRAKEVIEELMENASDLNTIASNMAGA
jgi:HD-like signal output (HDOD) protein/prolyl-tRNA editing enzyme YbaK/EbsC (Cys-tRNA(Pro) deacylase)